MTKITDFIGREVEYDPDGTYIWGEGNQMIAELRGWAAIQWLFRGEDGQIDFDAAAKFQDELGYWITDAINQKLIKEHESLKEVEIAKKYLTGEKGKRIKKKLK